MTPPPGASRLRVMGIVEATAVRKTYDAGSVQVAALRGVDLSIERGEMG